jgi:hypothetical protein
LDSTSSCADIDDRLSNPSVLKPPPADVEALCNGW